MRLIDTETGEFVNFPDLKQVPPYAILSHTWDKIGEQTYQEVVKIQEKCRPQSPPQQEGLPSNSRSDDPGAAPGVPTVQEAPSSPLSHSPLSVPQESPRSRSIFRRWLRMPRWTHIFSMIRLGTWLSRTHGPTTPPEQEPLPGAATSPEPLPPNEAQTSPTPPPTQRRSIWDSDSGLSEKVRKACEIAHRDGYRYIWIDSCCINKESSSELSEAINSMFDWYRAAQVCYSFLADVPSESDEDISKKYSKFWYSRWFTRGWTLQELVAPLVVIFLSGDWQYLGTKHGLADVIEEITTIDREILTHERALSNESVANRMQWASRRETTRVEDEAYSLLGIFGITMPTLYGEGPYAFRRLQEEILRRIPDQSLFAWGTRCVPLPLAPELGTNYIREVEIEECNPTLLAPSPRSFSSSAGRVVQVTGDFIKSLDLPVEEYTHTPYGIRTELCLLPVEVLNEGKPIEVWGRNASMQWYLVVLRSQHANGPQGLLGRLCYLCRHDSANVEFLFLAHWWTPAYRAQLEGTRHTITFALSIDDLARGAIRKTTGELRLPTRTVYLPHPKPSIATRQLEVKRDGVQATERLLRFTVSKWVQDVLRAGGYMVSNIQGPTEHGHNSFSFTLVHATFNIHIHYRHGVAPTPHLNGPTAVIIQARVWTLSRGEQDLCTSVIQSSPPSESATWFRDNQESWAVTLPVRRVVLTVPHSEDEVSLWLGLDLTAPLQYNIRVDITPARINFKSNTAVRASIRPCSKGTQPDHHGELELALPYYKTLDFILPLSARRALEVKGYSAHLALEPGLVDTPSHSLSLASNSQGKSTIVIKYHQLHTHGPVDPHVVARSDLNPDFKSHLIGEKFKIVARITLESSESTNDGPDTVQDGPHVVCWYDESPWRRSLEEKVIVLTTPAGDLLTLHLGFDFAWHYEYHLNVDIKPSTRPLQLSSTPNELAFSLTSWAHSPDGINLTLPAHVKRALEAGGYKVHFQRPGARSGGPIIHLLTLSHIHASVIIDIKYSYNLTTHYPEPDSDGPMLYEMYRLLVGDPQPGSDSDTTAPTPKAPVKRCRQRLTFQASVSVQGDTLSQVAAPSAVTPATVDWDEQEIGVVGWRQPLPMRDITITLSTGRQLMLRLGFYLVWYSQYCPTVEINPRTPLWRGYLMTPHPHDVDLPPMPDYALGEDGMEYIRQVLPHSQEPGQSAEARDEPPLADPSIGITAEGSPARSSKGPGGEGGDNPDPDSHPEVVSELMSLGSGA